MHQEMLICEALVDGSRTVLFLFGTPEENAQTVAKMKGLDTCELEKINIWSGNIGILIKGNITSFQGDPDVFEKVAEFLRDKNKEDP